MSKSPEIVIASGGFAGITLALVSFDVGIRARVFASASELRELGVGINVLPRATQEFKRLGILDRLTDRGDRRGLSSHCDVR